MPKVTKIAPTKTLQNRPINEIRKKRVAAYARVSTELEEQQSSYAAQIDYYTKFISNNPNWELINVYADEGISGTSTKKREGFNNMIKDAEDGKIDIILTKSMSRFARNTLDTIKYVRRLRDVGVEVRFEKECINSMDKNGETALVLMASLAEEESHSISENVKWGKQQSMAKANVSLPYKNFLGYRKGADGRPEIVEEEAKIIRNIYELFLMGKSLAYIAKQLTTDGIKTPSGLDTWKPGTVKSILTNEKYKGDALLGKTFTKDFLTKKVIKNTGQQAQYYVSESHEAIIDPATFDLVQHELMRRANNRGSKNDYSPFAGKVFCKHCNELYGHKVWAGRNTKYDMWVCNCKSNHLNEKYISCNSANLREETLTSLSITAINNILARKGEIRANYSEKYNMDATRKRQDEILAEYREKQKKSRDNLAEFVKHGFRTCTDYTEYEKQHTELLEIAEQAKQDLADLEQQCTDVIAEIEKCRRFCDALDETKEPLTELDAKVFITLIERVIVGKKVITYLFKDGSTEKLDIPEK